MRKRILSGLLALCLCSAVPVPAAAAELPKDRGGTAYESKQTVELDGKPAAFQMYALRGPSGGATNYIRLRDLADALDGTPAQFNVKWDGDILLETGKPYTDRNGSEDGAPCSGDQRYRKNTATVKVDGEPVTLNAFTIAGSTYFQLRELGDALGFLVDWTAERGVYIETALAGLGSSYGYQALCSMKDPPVVEAYLALRGRIGSFDGSRTSEKFTFSAPLTSDQFNAAWMAFRGDTPQYFWYSPYYPQLTWRGGRITGAEVAYSYRSPAAFKRAKAEFDAAVDDFLATCGVKPGMSELLTELILYARLGDYIHVEDVEDMEQLTYRAMVERRASCLGTSNAFAYALQRCGLMAHVLNGVAAGGRHAWVTVRIDGQFYLCDLVWDANSNNGTVRDRWLNNSEAQFKGEHVPDTWYPVPVCDKTLEDCFRARGGVVSRRNTADAADVLSHTMERVDGMLVFPLYITGDFSSQSDFHRWWDQNSNCWTIMRAVDPSIKRAWSTAVVGSVWIITCEV